MLNDVDLVSSSISNESVTNSPKTRFIDSLSQVSTNYLYDFIEEASNELSYLWVEELKIVITQEDE